MKHCRQIASNFRFLSSKHQIRIANRSKFCYGWRALATPYEHGYPVFQQIARKEITPQAHSERASEGEG